MKHIIVLFVVMASKGYAWPVSITFKFNQANTTDSFHFSVFKTYLSHFRFYNLQNKLIHVDNKAYLMDLNDSSMSYTISIDCPSHETPQSIVYSIGLDSLTNASGALTGDLDPLKGMFWTWQSGYIHLKLEGQSTKQSNTNPVKYTYHLGGYRWPNIALMDKRLVYDSNGINVDIQLNLLVSKLNAFKTTSIMSPGPLAKETFVALSNYFTQLTP